MTTIEKKLERNIKKNYIFNFITNVDFTRGLWMLYLAFKGMSLFQIGMLEGMFHITSLIMEVPTGAIADLIGRKASRMAGRVSGLVALLIMMNSHTFWLFALSFFFTALSYNLESGAGEALVFDSMKSLNREKGFTKVLGKNEAIFNIASIFSLYIGGFLGQKSFTLVFISSIVICIGALLMSLSFHEPEVERDKHAERSFVNFAIHTGESFKTLFSKKEVAFLTLFTTTLSAFSTLIFYYIQNYWRSTGVEISTIGLFLALGSAVAAFVSVNVGRVERFVKKRIKGSVFRYPFLIFSIVIFGGVFGLAFLSLNGTSNVAAMLFLVMTMAGESGMYVSFNSFLNKHIPSKQRATIISIESMLFSLMMIAVFPVFGWLAEIRSFYFAFGALAVVSGVMLTASFFVIRRFSR